MASEGIVRNQTIRKHGVTFHVIRHTFPFTNRGFPPYFRFDAITRYAQLRWQIKRTLLKVQADLIHVHGTEYGYGLAALQSGLPFIVSIQGIINAILPISPSTFYKLQASIEEHVIRASTYFGSRTAWADSFVFSINPTATIYYLPEAVNPVFFNTVPAHSSKTLLMVGSVEERKGIAEALHAMSIVVREFPAAKLVVVGEGSTCYLEAVRRLSASVGVAASVVWAGFKTAQEIAVLHGTAAMLIHPTFIDNSPNSVAEAMASGLPVIASNVGGIPSIIQDGDTGILVEPGHRLQLAEAILKLLRNNDDRKRLGQRARSIALQRHLPAGVADNAMRAYREIIARETGTLRKAETA
jgi:glycosyltransferase involved in cell wall biosynthesis